jgi:hypothetical protein
MYKPRTIAVAVGPEHDAIFSESLTRVEIDDHAAGEFVVVRQQSMDSKLGEIAIDPRDWPALRAAINKMVRECRD